MRRENSARKEAVPLLQRYLAAAARQAAAPPAGEAPPAQGAAPAAEAAEAAAAAADAAAGDAAAGEAAAGEPGAQQQLHLAPIKLACRGVAVFKLASSTHQGDAAAALATAAVAALVRDVEGGAQARLTHVHRLVPVQTTCALERDALAEAGGRLAALVAAAVRAEAGAAQGGGSGSEPAGKLTFGIAVKHRVLESPGQKAAAAAAAAAATAAASAEGEAHAGAAPPDAVQAAPQALDRGGIISALAGGFEGALRRQHGLAAAVDLKSPSWVLVVEAVPAGGALYAALAALPRDLCVLKPKLHIRAVGRGAGA